MIAKGGLITINIIVSLIIVVQWIVFALTVSRVRKSVFTNAVEKNSKGSISEDSTTHSASDNTASISGGVKRQKESEAMKVVWKRRLLYSFGMLVGLSVHIVDTTAVWNQAFIVVNILGTLTKAMFGSTWVMYFGYCHLETNYTAECGLRAPEWAPKVFTILEIYFTAGFIVLMPLFGVTHRVIFLAALFLHMGVPLIVFGLALFYNVRSLYNKLASTAEKSMQLEVGNAAEERFKRVRRFRIGGYLIAGISVQVGFVCVIFAIIGFIQGNKSIYHLDPTMLTVFMFTTSLLPIVGATCVQFVQWITSKPKRRKSLTRDSSYRTEIRIPRSPTNASSTASAFSFAETPRASRKSGGAFVPMTPSSRKSSAPIAIPSSRDSFTQA